jgi:hypothetical protein
MIKHLKKKSLSAIFPEMFGTWVGPKYVLARTYSRLEYFSCRNLKIGSKLMSSWRCIHTKICECVTKLKKFSFDMIDRLGTIHLERPQFGGGKGSYFIEICWQTIEKNCRRGGVKVKFADVLNGWSLAEGDFAVCGWCCWLGRNSIFIN